MSESTLKPGWTRVKFGDVVRQVKDKVDVEASSLDRYIAGEHMDTDDLRIRRWGIIDDGYLGPAFHMRFKPGQVLYGSRRTYLRKVAVPDFEGICANTTFVLESKDETVLLPELLPFIMQTEVFHDHSIKQSKGSVNPYVNFSDLAWYEFAVPTLKEQKRIVELMAAARNVKESLQNTLSSLEICHGAMLDRMVHQWETSSSIVPLAKMLQGSPDSGCSAPPRDNPTGHWVLALSALTFQGYKEKELKPVDKTEKMMSALLKSGDLLISRSNTLERVGLVGIYSGELEGSVSFPDTMMRLNVDKHVTSNVFLELVLQSVTIRRRIMSIAAGTSASMKKINRQNLLQISIPMPDPDEQFSAVATHKEFQQAETNIHLRLALQSQVYSQLLTRVLDGGHC